MRSEDTYMEATRNVGCDVDGDAVAEEVLQAYHQAMDDLVHNYSENVHVERGLNDFDNEQGSLGEDGDVNVDDNHDEDCDGFAGEEDLTGDEYHDEDDVVVSESQMDDNDDRLEPGATNESEYFEEDSNSDQNQNEEVVIDDVNDF